MTFGLCLDEPLQGLTGQRGELQIPALPLHARQTTGLICSPFCLCLREGFCCAFTRLQTSIKESFDQIWFYMLLVKNVSSFWRKIILSKYYWEMNTPELVGFDQELLEWGFKLPFCLHTTWQTVHVEPLVKPSPGHSTSQMKADGHSRNLKASAVFLWAAILQFCDFSFFFSESWIERCLNESENKRYSSHTSLGNVSNDESKCLTSSFPWRHRLGYRPGGRKSTSRVLGWPVPGRNRRLWWHWGAAPGPPRNVLT